MENYSQKPLLELFKAGSFPGENSVPRHVETVISNVFIFDKDVYKFYKNDADFFNKNFRDISGGEARFSFTEKDFQWNQILSPDIYVRLAYIAVKEGNIVKVLSKEEAEEILMVMNRVDTHNVLFEKLVKGDLTEEDYFEIGKQMGESMKKVQTSPSERQNFSSLFIERVKDVREWMTPMSQYFNEGEPATYCDFLDNFRVQNQEWFDTTLSDEVTADGDFHSQNAIYTGHKFSLMDTYPPKNEWGLGHKHIALYRLGVDIWGLTGKKEFFEAFLKGYETGNNAKVDRKLDNMFVVYAACIAVSYFYMLQQSDSTKVEPAKKFHSFLRDYFDSIS